MGKHVITGFGKTQKEASEELAKKVSVIQDQFPAVQVTYADPAFYEGSWVCIAVLED